MILKVRKKALILSFEANPKFESYLRHKYRKLTNIRTFNCAVSSVNGQKDFFLNVFDETSSFEELNVNSSYLRKKSAILGVNLEHIIKDKIVVNCKTLDSIIESSLNGQIIDLLKIDVEGHELEVLKGLTLNYAIHIKRIQTEFHFDDMYLNSVALEEILSMMNSLGFREELRYKHKFGNFIEIIFRNSRNLSEN